MNQFFLTNQLIALNDSLIKSISVYEIAYCLIGTFGMKLCLQH